jgi:hypothetical protein
VKFRSAGLWAPVLAAVFAIVLTPSSVLADANPSNHGHHYHFGWVNHHSPPPAPQPLPQPGGGTTTTGPTNSIVAVVVPADVAAQAPQAPTVVPPETPVLGPRDVVTTAQPILAARNLWLVAILLAAVVAVNVTLAVLAVGRGGHLAIKRTLAPVGIRV